VFFTERVCVPTVFFPLKLEDISPNI